MENRNGNLVISYNRFENEITLPLHTKLTDEEVDAGYYENDWVKVVLLGTSPVKYEIVLKTNTSREWCQVRIGINCFHYSYRILSIVQQSGE